MEHKAACEPIIADNIPSYMRNQRHWILYHFGPSNKNGKPRKIPDSAYGSRAININEPANWATFDDALHAFQMGGFDGIGFVFNGTDVIGIDIDHCVDPESGQYNDVAKAIIKRMGSTFGELSPSETGLHLYGRGKLPSGPRRNDSLGVEMYGEGSPRYFTVTGRKIEGATDELVCDQQAIDDIHKMYIASAKDDKNAQKEAANASNRTSVPVPSAAMLSESDEDIIRIATAAKNGSKFERLMRGDTSDYENDHSRADLAFCCMLAYWTRGNKSQMDSIFRHSGLMRDKWDEARGGQTYGERTLEIALENLKSDLPHFDLTNAVITKSTSISADSTGETAANNIVEQLRPMNLRQNFELLNSELGGAELFSRVFGGTCRYVSDIGAWYAYDGVKWRRDAALVMAYVQDLARAIYAYVTAQQYSNEDVRDAFLKAAKMWMRRTFRSHVLADAESLCRSTSNQFDADPYLLNLGNGTYDLRTFEFRPHQASDMLTQVAAVNFNPAAKSELWLNVITQAFESDADRLDYFQRAAGYTLLGVLPEECLFLLNGCVRAGKGTIISAIQTMLGDYSCTISADSISATRYRNGSGPTDDLARLNGIRLAVINEPDRHMSLDTGLIKAMTGNDKIAARHLREATIEFAPKFTIWIVTNYPPSIDDPTVFSSGRVRLISFTRQLGDAEQDHSLKGQLTQADELEGIFNWCLQGLRAYNERGLTASTAMQAQNDELARENDIIGTFLDENLVPDSDSEVKTTILHESYTAWCKARGYKADNYKTFLEVLRQKHEVLHTRPSGAGRKASSVCLIRGYRLGNGGLRRYTGDKADY